MKNIKIFLTVMLVAPFIMVREVDSSFYLIEGLASWYSNTDPGVLETTANMEIFDDTEFTCAIWDLSFNTVLKVTNIENGKYIYVRVNDRGPAKRLVQEGRVIDLTKGAFKRIADLDQGLINVSVEIVL